MGLGRPICFCLELSLGFENWSAPDNNATTSIGFGNNVGPTVPVPTLCEIPVFNEECWKGGFDKLPCGPIGSEKTAAFVNDSVWGAGNVNCKGLSLIDGSNAVAPYENSNGSVWDVDLLDATDDIEKKTF